MPSNNRLVCSVIFQIMDLRTVQNLGNEPDEYTYNVIPSFFKNNYCTEHATGTINISSSTSSVNHKCQLHCNIMITNNLYMTEWLKIDRY